MFEFQGKKLLKNKDGQYEELVDEKDIRIKENTN